MVWSRLRQGLTGVLLEVCFPLRCAGCAERGPPLCRLCREGMERLPAHRCACCGDGLLFAGPGRICNGCRSHPPAFERLICGYAFAGPLRSAIHQLKYRRARYIAPVLGEILCEVADAERIHADLITAVPLHPSRYRARGFNQSELIARSLATGLALPLVPSAVQRVVDTPPQMALPATQRRANVASAFAGSPSDVGGRRVLLVDDVATTGATLDATALALRAAGAREVVAITVARAFERVSR